MMPKTWRRNVHAIEVQKRDGRDLLTDSEGPLLFMSKVKATDHLRAARAAGRFTDAATAKLVRVWITIKAVETDNEQG